MTSSAPRVVITGAGVLTALGDRPETLHGALCEGHSGLHPLEDVELRAGGMPAVEVGQLTSFEPASYLSDGNLRPLDRTSHLAATAAQLAIDSAGGLEDSIAAGDVGLALGTMFGSVHTISAFDRRAMSAGPRYAKPMQFANSVINAAAGQTAIWHKLSGINATISGSSSSGLQAIAYAADLIRSGRATTLLAGGAEELCFESLYCFHKAHMLTNGDGGCAVPFHAKRSGFSIGEAAALVVLERADAAQARGANILAEIDGSGSAFDRSLGNDSANAASAMARSIRTALANSGIEPDQVDCLSGSANGSINADRTEAIAAYEVFGERTRELPVTATKAALGETLGASGAIQVITLVETMRSGLLPGIRGLSERDPDIPLAGAGDRNVEVDVERGLATSVGLKGSSSALVVKRWKAGP